MSENPIPPVFEGLLNDSQTQRFEVGKLLIKEDAATSNLYIILKGRVRVYKNYGRAKIPLATLGPGEIVGELAMLSEQARSASVEALTPVIALAVETAGLRDKISPPWILPVLQVVATRLKQVNQSLTSLRNMNEFAKRSFNRDYNAEFIVNELLRFTKTLLAFVSNHYPKYPNELSEAEIRGPLKETIYTLQSPFVDEKLFERAGRFSGIISEEGNVNMEQLDELRVFLEAYSKRDSIRLPRVSCLRLIEENISSPIEVPDGNIVIDPDHERFKSLPLHSEAFEDLSKVSFVVSNMKGQFIADKEELTHFWVHMRFIKAFDFSDLGV